MTFKNAFNEFKTIHVLDIEHNETLCGVGLCKFTNTTLSPTCLECVRLLGAHLRDEKRNAALCQKCGGNHANFASFDKALEIAMDETNDCDCR